MNTEIKLCTAIITVPWNERADSVNQLMATRKVESIKIIMGENRRRKENGLGEPANGLATLQITFIQ